MAVYEYFCAENNRVVEVEHSIKRDALKTWGEVCAEAKIEPGDTPPDTPVERLISRTFLSTPVGDSHLKNIGFTKLVKRDQGVYENVTRTGKESRYMEAGKPETMPDIKKKVKD